MPTRDECLRALVWFAAVCLGTWGTWRALAPRGPDPVDFSAFESGAHWVAPADPRAAVAQFRDVLVLPSGIRSAWIAVAAQDGFEIMVNGTSAGRSFVSRPTRPFQNGLSESGQRVVPRGPALDLSFPREYQWETDRKYRLPAFFDIGPLLAQGKNAIAIEVEARTPPARLAVEGEILLWSGVTVRIESEDFKVPPAPPAGGRLWTQADFSDLDWAPAGLVEPPAGTILRILDPDVYRQPFLGEWLRAPQRIDAATWYETTWSLAGRPDAGWIRLVANRPFELFVNHHPVEIADSRPQELDGGDWIIGPRPSVDSPAAAESLDPDEVGTLFVGSRFEAAPVDQDRSRPFGAAGFDFEQIIRGSNLDQPSAASTADERGRLPPVDPLAFSPQGIAPKELAGSREQTVFYAYAVQSLLGAGDNVVTIRLSAPDDPQRAVWSAKLAVDGQASFGDGSAPNRLDPARGWVARIQGPGGALSEPMAASGGGAASAPSAILPSMIYRGIAEPSSSGAVLALLESGILTALGLLSLSALPDALRGRRSRFRSLEWLRAPESTWILVLPAALLFSVWLVDLSWAERDESLRLAPPGVWRWIMVVAALLGAAGAFVSVSRWRPRVSPGELASGWVTGKPWSALVGLVMVGAAFLRAHDLQAQPLDDDELASTQAALAIARTGLPGFNADVYYTRGPLYHYIVGASVKVLGPSLWALRLPSIVFGVATAMLVYLVGAQLLRSRWTGLVAAGLYAIHPYAIFVGHLVRFYQQQQFFALATVYCFCRGFVTGQRSSWRYWTLAAFLSACLSQELSVVLVPPLLLAYVLYAEKKDRRSTMAFLVAGGCAAALLVVDLVIFQTRCLTKLEGISPNVEATLGFHFMSPMNLAAVFVCYSRLHLALSLLLFASVPLLVREGLRDARREVLVLLLVLFFGVVATNLLVTGESFRYQYWLVPFWLLAGVHGVRALVVAADEVVGPHPDRPVAQWIGPLGGALALTAVVCAFSPWRIAGSYGATLLGDSASAFAYVRTHLRQGDKIAATEPHAHAGLLELGRIDYDLAIPLLHDFVYRKDGHLVDRNGNARVVSSLEQLKAILANNDRVWVLVNREKFRSRGQNIRWEYPAARVELFLRQNFEVEYQSYLWTVFLWDAGAGNYHTLPVSNPPSWEDEP